MLNTFNFLILSMNLRHELIICFHLFNHLLPLPLRECVIHVGMTPALEGKKLDAADF